MGLFSFFIVVLYLVLISNKEELLYVLGYDEDLDDVQIVRSHYPIFYDSYGNFRALNNVSHESVFIIDSKNKILYQGPPPFIKDVRDKYIQILSKS